jgi:hypothetical protein
MTLRLRSEIFETHDMVSGIKEPLRVIGPVISELSAIRSIIAQKGISEYNAIRFDRLLNDRNQCILLSIRNDNSVDRSASPEQTEYQSFTCHFKSAVTFSGAANVTLVDLNLT